MAIDYGEKRIGIAVSDETKTIAQPKPYCKSRREVLEFITEYEAEKILLGLPAGLGGQETAAGKKVREFGDFLAVETKLPVEFINERFTTAEALKQLRGEGQSASGSREFVDSLVAQKMLERYLEKISN